MRLLSLFSGIGTTELAAHTLGFETVAFCEIDPFCRSILAKRFPEVSIFEDITKLRGDDVGAVDLICGGFPCQDLSCAGHRKGFVHDGERTRSGLWYEMLRLVGECKPAIVIAENVRGAINIALDAVTAGLEAEGYEVETLLLPASIFGAPHQRYRIFVFGVRKDVADAFITRCEGRSGGEIIDEKRREESAGQSANGGALWATPTVHGTYKRRGASACSGDGLATQVKNWPTPSLSGMAGGSGSRKTLISGIGRDQARKISTGNCGGQLNPDWVECLQGLPIGWTNPDCETPEPWRGWPMGLGLEQYDWEPPRIVEKMPNRRARLKALGNCNPPQMYVPVLLATVELMKEEWR